MIEGEEADKVVIIRSLVTVELNSMETLETGQKISPRIIQARGEELGFSHPNSPHAMVKSCSH